MSGGVGFSKVADFANTYPGQAQGVVADAHNGFGDDVGGQSVIVNGPAAAGPYYILMETTGYVLQENDDKIELE
jgi:cytochrome c oxidase assembly protein Cox11